MTKTISNADDVIDSRDVIERIEELEAEREELFDACETLIDDCIDGAEDASVLSRLCGGYRSNPKDELASSMLADYLEEHPESELADARQALIDWDADNAEELKALKALAEEGEGRGDWEYGAQLIRESYFEDHIRELVDDCYTMPEGFNSGEWPWRHMEMDWKAAADEAKQDYTEVTFSGVTYYIR